ncbi:hypothetical protein J2Z49_002430 [Desulfofundulus luciae]|uniref:FeS cluster biogenesis domain-containing protein n=1 Tax=Desulfofundulus luciae TaxID=74702 RepID=A0ABU0B3L5_9FIRM|nr:CC/Se motif family (seleno)protein [Desulfofundulus luciae]MDQ0287309.1 hypothetical protein [Desulfofundulus luciae]
MRVIKMSPSAREYILSRGYRAVTVELEGLGGCCCPLFLSQPVLGFPDNPEHYRVFEVGGIQVFVDKTAAPGPGEVEIALAQGEQGMYLEVRGLHHLAENGLCGK